MYRIKKILIVDDTEINIDILVGLLSQYDLLVATDGYSAIEILKEEKVDLILLDIMMPNINGYETCELIKKDPEIADIPVIFLTAKIDEDSIEKAYDVGGIDFVTKPFKPRELLARIKTQLNMQQLLFKLEHMASYDSMTGIYNRRKFFEIANELFVKKKESLSVVMIDIDKFKRINDKYGHPIGDKVIKSAANCINSLIDDKKSLCARLGGEEFVILYFDMQIDNILTEVERIRTIIENLQINIDDNNSFNFTISSGISQYKSEKTIDELLKNADDALYEAKDAGRNRLIFRV